MYDAMTPCGASPCAEAAGQQVYESDRMAAIERMAEIARPFLGQPGAVTVDLGCGTGLFAVAVGIPAIVGVDASPGRIRVARWRMDRVRCEPPLEVSIERGSADHVVSLFLLDDDPDARRQRFFDGVFSLLRPQGRFFFAAETGRAYDTRLRAAGFTVQRAEVVASRESRVSFALRVARKPGQAPSQTRKPFGARRLSAALT